jgi:hypothetical protein
VRKPRKQPDMAVANSRRLKEKITFTECQRLAGLPYERFLDTAYWRTVSAYVIHRQGKQCALCPNTRGIQVHHKTYDHHGEEHRYLNDLIGLCRAGRAKCEERRAAS